MAVFDRSYRAYEGPLTPASRRFLVLARYGLKDALRSRIVTLVFAASFLPPIVGAVLLYFRHNLRALTSLGIQIDGIPPVDARFFLAILSWQSFAFGGLLTLLIGPGLVSSDLVNGALPLYLGRPLTRAGYVAGKLTVLGALLSVVTWIPGLILFGIASVLEGWGWTTGHARIPVAIVVGSVMWIASLALMALAASALARKRVVAQGLLVGAILGGAWIGGALQAVFGVPWGHVLNLPFVMQSLLESLYAVPLGAELPLGLAVLALPSLCALCLAILARRLRAKEVVR